MAVQQGTQKDAIVPLLLLISATTGLIDAVSVLGLGKVFTANMTGNIVFLGFALAGTPGFSWLLYVVALLSFAVGLASADGCARRRPLVVADPGSSGRARSRRSCSGLPPPVRYREALPRSRRRRSR